MLGVGVVKSQKVHTNSLSTMAALLGEVRFEELATGRVRCLETGHEMPVADQSWYGRSKKCRRALIDLYLAQGKPPLDLFEQSPLARDKLICRITGDTLNKTEDALSKHMNGKKFQRKLTQKKTEKMETVQCGEAALTNIPVQCGGQDKFRLRRDSSTSCTENDDSENERMDFERFIFREDDIKDFNTKHDGMDATKGKRCDLLKNACISSRWMSDHKSDEDNMVTRTKRIPATGPDGFIPQKKTKTEDLDRLFSIQ